MRGQIREHDVVNCGIECARRGGLAELVAEVPNQFLKLPFAHEPLALRTQLPECPVKLLLQSYCAFDKRNDLQLHRRTGLDL